MNLFTDFFAWLNALLAGFLGATTARIAAVIEPAAITLGAIYVMLWGIGHWRGRIQEPVIDGIRRIVLLGIVFGVALQLWSYNSVLVEIFFRGPQQFAAAVLGAPTAVGALDALWRDANLIAEALIAQGSLLGANFAYYLAGFLVYLVAGVACAYAAFLMALALMAVAVLLAIGPVVLLLTLFEATRRTVESWFGQLANYAFVGMLVAIVASLLLGAMQAFAAAAVAAGPAVTIAEALRFCVVSALIFLILRQVLPMAAGLGAGLALSTGSVWAQTSTFALRRAGQLGYVLGRGVSQGTVAGWRQVMRPTADRVTAAASGAGSSARAVAAGWRMR
jgi:type IV secretion system protein VirB6